MSFISLFSLLGYLIYGQRKGLSALNSIIVSFSFIIFIQYWFGLFDHLLLGLYVIWTLGICLFFTYIKTFISDALKKFQLKDVAILLYVIPFFIVFYSVPDNYQFSIGDEFADWGMAIKYMHENNKLYSFFSRDYFQYRHYPPAQQLFQYFFLGKSQWSEHAVMYSQLLLILGAQVSLFSTSRNRYILGALGFFASLTLMMYFHFFYNNIYADGLLAVYFAATFGFIIRSKCSWFENAICCLMLFVLVQIKQVGLVFSAILLMCYLIKILFSQITRENKRWIFSPNLFATSKKNLNGSSIYPISFFIVALLSVVISSQSWSIFRQFHNLVGNKIEKIPALIRFFEAPLSDQMLSATHLFIIRMVEQSFTFNISFYQIILTLFILGSVLSLLLNRKSRFVDFSMITVIGFGSIVYFLFVLFSYIVFFSEFEGTTLSGFERYTAIYFIGWVFILFGYMTQFTLTDGFRKAIFLFSVAYLLLLHPPHNFYQVIGNNKVDLKILDQRSKMINFKNEIGYLDSNAKIFLVAQGHGELIKSIFYNTFMPQQLSTGCYSFGRPYGVEDIYTCNKSFLDSINGYDYLVLFDADVQFWALNDSLFPPDSRGLNSGVFKVEWTKDVPKFIRLYSK
jgi:hypothetical protein